MGCGASTAAPAPKDPETAVVAAEKAAPAVAAGPVHPKVSKIFTIIDKNADGALSKKELLLALRKSEEAGTELDQQRGNLAAGLAPYEEAENDFRRIMRQEQAQIILCEMFGRKEQSSRYGNV